MGSLDAVYFPSSTDNKSTTRALGILQSNSGAPQPQTTTGTANGPVVMVSTENNKVKERGPFQR